MKKQLPKKEQRSCPKRTLLSTFQRLTWVVLFSCATLAASAQNRTITGTVLDTNDQPIPGANIVLEGTARGTTTGGDGTFSLPNAPASGNLQVSMIGYVAQTIALSNQNQYRVTLLDDTQFLDEVVVVGYGVQRKSDVTGAMVSVGSDELNARPVSNALEGLQGRAAGVDITNSSRPGELGSIRIRGSRSLTASNEPLYVVDGIPLTMSGGFTSNSSGGGIETLNPQDIESIDILKDASATAIYGSRGANGVVLVTTKKGTEGRFSLRYSGSITIEDMAWKSKNMNAAEYIDFARWAYWGKDPVTYARGDQPSAANDALIFSRDPYAANNVNKGWANGSWDPSLVESFDWMGAVTQSNYTHDHTVSVSGGTQNMRAYASIGFLDNQGTTKGQSYKRYTARASVDITPKKWFTMGLNLSGTLSDQEYGQASIGTNGMSFAGNLISQAMSIFPYAVPYDDQGNVIQYPGGENRVPTIMNEWEYSHNNRESFRMQAMLYAQVNILEGLNYRVEFGPDYRYNRNGLYMDGQSLVRGGSSYASYATHRTFDWTVNNLLNYNKTWGKHTIGATFLQTASAFERETASHAGSGIPFSSMKWYAITKANVPTLTDWSTGLTESQMMSWMGRLNYSFNDRYLITVSGRWDGASQLAEGHKWAFFPSAAFAWRLEQEEFIKRVPWIQQLKLRVGYGVTGNAAVDPYATKGDINSTYYTFGSDLEQAYVPYDGIANATNKLANSQLGWEKTSQLNFGIDFSLFRGRLAGGVDIYTSKTTDLLMDMTIPTLTGYASTMANVGSTKNFGVDFTINSLNVQTKDFSWSTTLTGAWQREEIVELMYGKQDMVDKTWFIGQPISVYYGYEGKGLWQDTPEDLAEMAKFNANGHQFAPGLTRPVDQNGDYKITANEDRVILGRRDPDWSIGFNNTFAYKNWELSIFMNGRLGLLTNTGQGLTALNGNQRNVDYWTPNNTNASYQKPIHNEAGGDPYYEVNHYEDNSYIVIRNISLGYNVPKSFANKLGIDNLRVYAQVRDPGMLWSKLDFHWADGNRLWWNRGFTFGLNIGF